MKVAIVVLLFANLAFFAWASWIDTPLAAAPAPAAKKLAPLVLAAEADARAKDGGGPNVPSSGSASNAPRCMSVGPFNSEELATDAQTQLRERGYQPRQRSQDGERWDGYWVYIDNLKSDLEEARVMRTLIQAALSDARIMPITDQGRRISVGVFSERARAERRAHVLERLNLEPRIGDRTVPGTVYWMDVDLKSGESTLATEGLLPPETPGPALRVQACEAG